MAIPVLETWAVSDNTSNTTITVTKPTGVVANDIGIVMVITKSDNVITDEFNTPVGWTKIVGLIPSNTNVDCMGMAYYRVCTGDAGDDAPVVTWTTAAPSVGWYARVSGVNTSDVINIAGLDAQANANSIACPSVTTDANNCLAFYYQAFDGGDGMPFSVTGTGWAEVDDKSTSDSASTNVVSGSWGTKDQATAGATGDATVTATTEIDGIMGAQFALNEAVGGATISDVNYSGANRGVGRGIARGVG